MPDLATASAAIQDVIERGDLRPVFQPVVELEGGAVVGYEALIRGPAGTALEFPAELFDAARQAGLLVDLDRASRAAATAAALEHGLDAPRSLFINTEPETLALDVVTRNAGISDRAVTELRPVVEITERALAARPAELVHAVSELRERGIGVALDDVGADQRSLAFMPLLRPDVIKLDLQLVQSPPSPDIFEVVTAVQAHAERTGAVVLAEGVETEEQVAQARSFGATLAQGFYFGAPAPLPTPESPAPAGMLPRLLMPGMAPAVTPLALIGESADLREGTLELMFAIGMTFERHATRLGDSGILLAAFDHPEEIPPEMLERWRKLAGVLAFEGMVGPGMRSVPAAGIRGATIAPTDPLARETAIVALGPHFAAATAARDITPDLPLEERRYEFGITYERTVAISAARSIIARIGRNA